MAQLATGNKLENGDTYFVVDNNNTTFVFDEKNDTTKEMEVFYRRLNDASDYQFGIDNETVVFYWGDSDGDGDDEGAVAMGYDNLYDVTQENAKISAVMYNPQAFGTTGESRRAVAEVIVVVGDYEAHNDYNYCLVLDTYKNYPDYNIYEVILDDGTITTLKTEDDLNADFDGVNKMVYA